MTLLSPHFSLEELIASDVAARVGINNNPPPEIIENLKILAAGLEQVRTVLANHPIHITSGYRCRELNFRIGGAKNSAHMEGLAADILCPEFGKPLDVCRAIAAANLGTDQIIHEYATWCHVAFPAIGTIARNELLTIRAAHGIYEEGLLI